MAKFDIRKVLVVALVAVVMIGAPLVAQDLDPMAQIDRNAAEWLQSIEDGTAVVPRTKRATHAATVQKMTGPNYVCLPTCTENDGRFLSIAGEDLQTLSGTDVVLRLGVPAEEASFELGIFDGDSSGAWDFASGSPVGVPLEYTLRADPDQDGGGPIVAQWNGATMLDNAWTNFTVSTGLEAAAPSGNYFYLLTVSLTDISVLNEWSNFKVRTTGLITTSVSVSPVAFSFSAPFFGPTEGFILYPNAATGDLTTTTYDGGWDIYLDIFESLQELTIWDGDFDRGSVGNTDLDTDDPDTPNAPFLPPWAVGTAARPEGVAFVLTCGSERSQTGCPADDRSQPIFLRSPAIRYEVRDPTEAIIASNQNPSGNREWEQFLISTTTSDPAVADTSVAALPPGTYHVRVEGVDIANLNAWRFFNAVVGVCEDGTPCGPILRPYLVGDSVFFDLDADGVQDANEVGISGVEIELVNGSGAVLATATTDADGRYEIMVEVGTYTVRPATSNFESGGALEGLIATNSPEQTGDVVDDNNLDFDFGFRGTSSIGDRVWVDANRNGQFDDGAGAGIDGVTLNLTGAGPDGAFDTVDDVDYGSAVTDGDGLYSFAGLPAGSYRVSVDDTTLPAGYTLVSGADPTEVALGSDDDVDDVDFGYFDPALAGNVRPILECVSNDGDGSYTAFFGYLNQNDVTVSIPVGDLNRFNPAPADRGQPVSFEPGRTAYWPDAAFGVSFDGGNLVWKLGNRTSTASSGSTPCSYHVFLEKEWVDGTGQPLPRPSDLSDSWTLTATSDLGTATCTYSAGSDELECVYENSAPALDDNGLWVPVGSSYTVSESFASTKGGRGGGRGRGRGGDRGRGGRGHDDGGTSNTGNGDGGSDGTKGGYAAIEGTGTFTMGPDGNDACVNGRDGFEKFCTHTVVNAPVPDGTGTIGYWKNHPEEWLVDSLTLGSEIYSQSEAIDLLRTPTRGDASIQLGKQLVATKLNVIAGNDSSCIQDTIDAADDLLSQYPVGTLDRKNRSVKNQMNALKNVLDDYNNGRLCAPHRG